MYYDFNNQMFNPTYVNPNYYHQMQAQIEAQRYEAQQNKEVMDAVKAVRDLCKAVKKMDMQHQQQAFNLCLGEIALECGWQC